MILYPSILRRGITLFPWFILIPRWAKDNVPYLAHEQVHAKQQRQMGVVSFWWKYLTNKSVRQALEIEAFKIQIAHGASISLCAQYLSNGYRLGITQAEALKLLETT